MPAKVFPTLDPADISPVVDRAFWRPSIRPCRYASALFIASSKSVVTGFNGSERASIHHRHNCENGRVDHVGDQLPSAPAPPPGGRPAVRDREELVEVPRRRAIGASVSHAASNDDAR
jgi:hypothetical protein